MNISGVIVYAADQQAEKVERELNNKKGVEVHASQEGKLVVTVEHESINGLADQVMNFQDIPGVMSVAMVYQHNEDMESLEADDMLVEEAASCTANTCNEYTSQEALS